MYVREERTSLFVHGLPQKFYKVAPSSNWTQDFAYHVCRDFPPWVGIQITLLNLFFRENLKIKALVTGIKQSRQPIKAEGLTRLAGRQGSWGCLRCFGPVKARLHVSPISNWLVHRHLRI